MAQKKKSRKAIIRIILSSFLSILLLVIGIVVCSKATLSAYQYTEDIIVAEAERTKSTNVTKTDLSVKAGTTIDDIAHILYKNGIITNTEFFIAEAKLDGTATAILPGEYTISSNMSSTQIMDILTTSMSDEDNTIKFTIPEGYTVEQIAESLQRQKIVSKAEFLEAVSSKNYAKDYDFLKDIPDNPNYKYALEGYLFPDTYIIRKNATAEEIIVKMLNRFDQIYNTYSSFAHASGYTTQELIAIASIIEHEAKIDEERAVISGVIYNRLKQNMRLQMCSTVQYVLNKRQTSLTYDDLQKDSPYNTYVHEGLPIGPICNPGEACIKAAIFPEDNPYLFFVLEDANTGKHCFTETIDEHQVAKNRYKQSTDINFTE